MVTSNDKLDANRIRQLVARYYTKKRWAVHFEVGLCKGGRYRADVVAMAMNAYLVIVEVKSSVADFRTDKKMQEYLKYANQVYLACSAEVYEKIKADVLPGIGVLIVVNGKVKAVKKAKKSDVHGKIKLNMITRMAYRSADVTKFERKSKTAGRKYVATKVVEAIQAVPKPKTKKAVLAAAEAALDGLV